MQDILLWQQRLRPLLAPVGAANALAGRIREALRRKGLPPSWTPPAPAVGVGSISSVARGKVMLSAWLLGWAKAKGLAPALLASPGDGDPDDMPLSVLPSTPPALCGTEAGLLSLYHPETVILADDNPVRAGKSAWETVRPDLFILHDLFSDLSVRRKCDIVLLGPHDLDKGWNRALPAGFWREGATALNRAGAFVLHLWPDELPLRETLAKRRLERFAKPVFTVWPKIWQLRGPGGETAESLGGEPYMLVAPHSSQDVAAKAAQQFLGLPPRLRVAFPDGHRFSPQDQQQLAADAARMKTPHVLATPEAALRLGGVPGRTLWTWDPEVVLGPCLLTGARFTPWWETTWVDILHAS
ncbi:tetraacyldisaccharide 4'-kinase [Fundidesulfovibrio soli]|uniref:tetraacyldisaccharide 4'-kinase n=1 Tax=Fundidesulfovibrio soli TaxID=2922716 RepID=UPI001FAFC03A|nr:tetraacyldisaccharide 4'-kinase [Fundidesulfovibrio soli]